MRVIMTFQLFSMWQNLGETPPPPVNFFDKVVGSKVKC